MFGGKNWVREFVCAGLAMMLGGCGATPGDESSTFDGAESVGSVAQAVNESSADRQAAAVTPRGDEFFWAQDSYVFICNSSHRLMRNILVDYRRSSPYWYGWQRQTNKSCASTPTAMTWRNNLSRVGVAPGTPASHVVNVYWRDDNDQLWEVRYHEDGHTKATNLSSLLDLGPITGSPVVADVGDDANNPKAVSVAVRMRDTDELYTVEYRNGSWSVLPVLLTSGVTGSTGVGSIVTAYGYDSAMMSVQHNLGAHLVYKKAGSGQSFQQHAWTASAPAQAPKGVLSIGGLVTAEPNVTACLPNGCAMYRNPADNQLMWVPLSSGGLLNDRVKYGHVNAFQQNHDDLKPMGGSIWFDPAYPEDLFAFARGADNHLQGFTWQTNGWRSDSCSSTPLIISAPTVSDRQVLYAGSPGTTLFHVNLAFGLGCRSANPTVTNLGQQVLLQ